MLTTLFSQMQTHFRSVLHEPLYIRNTPLCDLCGEQH